MTEKKGPLKRTKETAAITLGLASAVHGATSADLRDRIMPTQTPKVSAYQYRDKARDSYRKPRNT